MKRIVGFGVLACVLVLLPLAAHGRDVYLNGVKLDSNVVLTNQTFPACEVKFDDKGDIWITAKGFKIDVKPAADEPKPAETPAPVGDRVAKRYWLVSTQTKRGIVQYDVDVFINGKFVKKVKSADAQVVLEVTKYVKPGSNKVRMVATKVVGDKRLSTSPSDVLEVVLGEGDVGGGTVAIDKPVATFRRTASETRNVSEDFTFVGR